MREIKFRAWDDVKNRMYFVAEEDDIAFELLSDGSFVGHDLTEDWNSPFKRLEHLKFMQYTGLKDKNSVEIYEGDIFKAPHDFGPGGMVERFAQVHFDIRRGYQWEYWDLDKIEVVGNIYENLELLEGTE